MGWFNGCASQRESVFSSRNKKAPERRPFRGVGIPRLRRRNDEPGEQPEQPERSRLRPQVFGGSVEQQQKQIQAARFCEQVMSDALSAKNASGTILMFDRLLRNLSHPSVWFG
eukprot:s7483_g5.t1